MLHLDQGIVMVFLGHILTWAFKPSVTLGGPHCLQSFETFSPQHAAKYPLHRVVAGSGCKRSAPMHNMNDERSWRILFICSFMLALTPRACITAGCGFVRKISKNSYGKNPSSLAMSGIEPSRANLHEESLDKRFQLRKNQISRNVNVVSQPAEHRNSQ